MAPGAGAAIVTLRDNEGRPMRFDVRAPGVDVEWYGEILRRAAHGNEVSRVTIRLATPAALRRTCRADFASGCYAYRRARSLIVVPAVMGTPTAHTLLHEYGHHLDRWRGVRGVPEPNGTAHWWKQRGMASLVRAGRVFPDYSHGWDRSIGEIFAEDYARLHLRTVYKIGWLSAPTRAVRLAVGRDVRGVPNTSMRPPPFTIVRQGALQPGRSRALPFGLLGPGRRVTFAVALQPAGTGARVARMTLRCGRRTVTRDVLDTEQAPTIDQRGLGPATDCRATLANVSGAVLRYTIRLRLALTV